MEDNFGHFVECKCSKLYPEFCPIHPFEVTVEKVNGLLPTNPASRKGLPIFTGVLMYFPLAIAEIAKVSKAGNDAHNKGEPLHWSRHKSSDHEDCLLRHLLERGKRDTDGQLHSAKVAWRALAMLQIELENNEKI